MDFTGRLTPQGQALLAALLLRGDPLAVTRVVAGSGTTPEDALTLDQPQQEATIALDETGTAPLAVQEAEAPSLSTLVVTLASSLASKAYSLTELGVYIRDDAGQELLYQVYRLTQPVEISPDSRLVLRTFLRTAVSDEATISLAHPPSGLLSKWEQDVKADLVNGQVPYSQTHRLTDVQRQFYVDANNGDDANPGTSDRPFRTIQAAVDAIPKNLGGGNMAIYLRPGTYTEQVDIAGFYSSDSTYGIAIYADLQYRDTTIVNGGFTFGGISTFVELRNFTIQGEGPSGFSIYDNGTNIGVHDVVFHTSSSGPAVFRCGSLDMYNCMIQSENRGVYVANGMARMVGCTITSTGDVGVECGRSYREDKHSSLCLLSDCTVTGTPGKFKNQNHSIIYENGVLV